MISGLTTLSGEPLQVGVGLTFGGRLLVEGLVEV